MIIYYVLTTLLLVITFVVKFNVRHWFFYAWRAQRFQIMILLVLALAIYPLVREGNLVFDILFVLLTGGAIFYNLNVIFPFTFFAPKEVPDSRGSNTQISVMAANVRMSNKKYYLLNQLISRFQPDVFLLSEVDRHWIEGLQQWKQEYPYSCLCPKDNTYGMALYSKLPLIDPEVRYLVDDGIPSIHAKIYLNEDLIVQFIGLHPRPPAPWTREQDKDFELIIAAGMINDNLLPTIVSGDLNDVAWSPVTHQFKVITGLLDPRVGRGFYNTYNVYAPFFRMPIDHFFVSPHFQAKKIRRLSYIGSDHFPIFVHLTLPDQPKEK